MTSTGRPPSLRPRWSRPSSNELRMSLPMAAGGPLNVLMKPILMVFCWGSAGAVLSASTATVPKRILFISAVLQDAGKLMAILVDRFQSQKPSGRGFSPLDRPTASCLPTASEVKHWQESILAAHVARCGSEGKRHARVDGKDPLARADRHQPRRLRRVRPPQDAL